MSRYPKECSYTTSPSFAIAMIQPGTWYLFKRDCAAFSNSGNVRIMLHLLIVYDKHVQNCRIYFWRFHRLSLPYFPDAIVNQAQKYDWCSHLLRLHHHLLFLNALYFLRLVGSPDDVGYLL